MTSGFPNRCFARLLLLMVCLFTQAGTAVAQRYPFYNVSIEQGLIQSQVQCMVQDKAGHLWVGTLGGLSRYDGHAFVSYSVRDGLPDNEIKALATDASGRIWIGTQKGLTVYDGNRFRQYIFQSPDKPRGNVVSTISSDRNGTIWCLAGRSLYSIAGDKVTAIRQPAGVKGIKSFCFDDQQRLVASFTGGSRLYRYSSSGWDSVQVADTGAPLVVGAVIPGIHKTWIMTSQGLFTYSRQGIRKAFPKVKVRSGATFITCLTEARDGSVWLGTNSGVLRVTDSQTRYYQKSNGFTDNMINAILTDAEGNVWMGSDGQGLFRFSGAPFIAMDESTRLPSAQIMALAADSKGGLYLGSYDAGLYYYLNNDIRRVPFPDNMAPTIVALATRSNDELWIGARNGLWRYNGSFRAFTAKDSLPSSYITALRTGPDDRLWIGFGDGAAVYDGSTFHRIPAGDNVVYGFLPLSADSVLIATGTGIMFCSAGQVKRWVTGTNLDSMVPQCFARQGNLLWVGTSDNGIVVYDMNKRQTVGINKSNGMKSDFIYNIFAAKNGHVWAGTGLGIYDIRIDRGRPVITFYGRGQGVTGMESNHNAVLGMPDGSIWFGTTNGAMQYRPGAGKQSAQPVSIVMQSVKLFGETITDKSYFNAVTPYYQVPVGLKLPPNKNNLTFTFQALSLSDESGISYRYHMEGLDAQWSDWASTNTITYSALPPGTYSLHVQCNVDGRKINRELVYSFTIITPFHKTSLFRFLIFGGCILLGVSLQYILNRRKQARLKMIEALRREEQAKVRERTAEDFHDEVGNKLTRINVLTNVLKSKLGDMPPDVRRIIEQIHDNTGQLYSGTRDILWSLKPSNDTVYEVVHRIRDFGRDLFGDTEVDFRFQGTDEAWRAFHLPMDYSRNLIMIFKEAMNNSLKYAQATSVTLHASMSLMGELTMELRDNGTGFDPETVRKGNGLKNMDIRSKRIHGRLEVNSTPGAGTTLILRFKIPRGRG